MSYYNFYTQMMGLWVYSKRTKKKIDRWELYASGYRSLTDVRKSGLFKFQNIPKEFYIPA